MRADFVDFMQERQLLGTTAAESCAVQQMAVSVQRGHGIQIVDLHLLGFPLQQVDRKHHQAQQRNNTH